MWEHSDATIDALDLEAPGFVRELTDGEAGTRANNSNLADGDKRWWAEYRNEVEATALRFRE